MNEQWTEGQEKWLALDADGLGRGKREGGGEAVGRGREGMNEGEALRRVWPLEAHLCLLTSGRGQGGKRRCSRCELMMTAHEDDTSSVD